MSCPASNPNLFFFADFSSHGATHVPSTEARVTELEEALKAAKLCIDMLMPHAAKSLDEPRWWGTRGELRIHLHKVHKVRS
jgi:hypothetical protein